MKKVYISTLLIIVFALAQNHVGVKSSFADESSSTQISIDQSSNVFGNELGILGRDRNQTQLKTQDQDKEQTRINNNSFMIKGNITASSSNSLTVNNQVINIDSSVTGNVKIVGNIQNGMYAAVQGIIQNSNYYATKIIVDQRNKNELNESNEENENITPTITPTSSITPTPALSETPTVTLTPTPSGTQSANIEESANTSLNLSLQNMINLLRNFFLGLKNSLSNV